MCFLSRGFSNIVRPSPLLSGFINIAAKLFVRVLPGIDRQTTRMILVQQSGEKYTRYMRFSKYMVHNIIYTWSDKREEIAEGWEWYSYSCRTLEEGLVRVLIGSIRSSKIYLWCIQLPAVVLFYRTYENVCRFPRNRLPSWSGSSKEDGFQIFTYIYVAEEWELDIIIVISYPAYFYDIRRRTYSGLDMLTAAAAACFCRFCATSHTGRIHISTRTYQYSYWCCRSRSVLRVMCWVIHRVAGRVAAGSWRFE